MERADEALRAGKNWGNTLFLLTFKRWLNMQKNVMHMLKRYIIKSLNLMYYLE